MQNIRIDIDENDLREVRRAFSGMEKIASKVVTRALNKTLTGVKTDASAAIREVLTAKKKAVDETFKIKKASGKDMSAYIASTGKPIPLISFAHQPTKAGIRIQVRRQSAKKLWPGTFKKQLKSGHQGIFQREYHATPRQPVRPGFPYGKLPREYRLPMKEKFGPRAPDILSNQPVMSKVIKQAQERLHKNIEHEMKFEMSKL